MYLMFSIASGIVLGFLFLQYLDAILFTVGVIFLLLVLLILGVLVGRNIYNPHVQEALYLLEFLLIGTLLWELWRLLKENWVTISKKKFWVAQWKNFVKDITESCIGTEPREKLGKRLKIEGGILLVLVCILLGIGAVIYFAKL